MAQPEVIHVHHWPGEPPLTADSVATCGARPLTGDMPLNVPVARCPDCIAILASQS